MTERFSTFVFVASLVAAAALAACQEDKTPSEDGVEREELGTFTTDTGGGIAFTVSPPAEAVSSLVYCGPYGYDLLATAETIAGPGGASVYDMGSPDATAMRVDIHSDILPILLPVSPDLSLEAGDYAYRVYFDAESAVSATCTAVYRVEAPSDDVTIDLDLVFVGVDEIAPGLNALEGADALKDVLAQVGEIWANAGLSIGNVSYADFDGDVDTYTIIDGDEEFGDLLRTVDGNRRTVTFFFVQEINDEGATILGLSGGPPGMAATGGTSKSGVVITSASFASDPGEVARIMAHEGGHFLGLFHTTEKDGSQHDPLSDTPECNTDTSGDGVYATNECEGTGAENLMFWTGANTGMSADQAWVIARSPATY